MSRLRSIVTLLLWSAAVASAIWSLDRLGTGSLAAPPLRDPGSLSAWAEEVGPVHAAMAVLRVIAWGLAWYLAVVTALGVVARLTRIPALVEWADLITLPPVRRVLSGAVGLSFVATTLAVSALPTAALVTRDHLSLRSVDIAAPSLPFGGVGDTDTDHDAPVLRIEDLTTTSEVDGDAGRPDDVSDAEDGAGIVELDDARTSEQGAGAADQTSVDASDAAAVLAEANAIVDDALAGAAAEAGVAIDDLVEQAAPRADVDQASEDTELPASPPAPATDRADIATWTIESGDHLWHVAEHVLTTTWGHPPTDAEIAPYWQRLIDANRDILADPDNPDLVFPGQTFHLPPVG